MMIGRYTVDEHDIEGGRWRFIENKPTKFLKSEMRGYK